MEAARARARQRLAGSIPPILATPAGAPEPAYNSTASCAEPVDAGPDPSRMAKSVRGSTGEGSGKTASIRRWPVAAAISPCLRANSADA
jgi:hypothetical protein